MGHDGTIAAQAKASRNSNVGQHMLMKETAERDKEEINVGKLLERVRAQMAKQLQPLTMDLGGGHFALFLLTVRARIWRQRTVSPCVASHGYNIALGNARIEHASCSRLASNH
jgi:hypothetical protein